MADGNAPEPRRHPRSSPEAERALAAACLFDDGALAVASSIVAPADFFDERTGLVFDAALACARRREALDPIAIEHELRSRGEFARAGGAAHIARLFASTGSGARLEQHARLIAELAAARRIGAAGRKVASAAEDPTVPVSELAGSAVREITAASLRTGDVEAKTCADVGVELYDELIARADPAGAGGLPTGLADLDAVIGGYFPQKLYLIAGRPGMGKSAFGLLGARAAENAGKPALVFTLEMTAKENLLRAACELAGLDSRRVIDRKLTKDESERFIQAVGEASRWSILWDEDARVTPDDIRARAMRAHARQPLGMILVDYVQKIRPRRDGSRNRTRDGEIREAIEELKALSKELKVPVLALAQLNRDVEDRPNKRPLMSDLRESGTLEQEADAILFLYRDEYYNPDTADRGICEVAVAKQRGGAAGRVVPVRFEDTLTRFSNLEDADRAAWASRREGGRGAKPRKPLRYAAGYGEAAE
jgi:replicative DNA helicase